MGIFDRLKKIFCAKATAEQRTDETTECAAEKSVVPSVMQEPAAVKFHPESPVVSFSEEKQLETEKIQPVPAPAVVEQKHAETDALPYEKGHDEATCAELTAFFSKINALYPDKVVVGLTTDHKHLSEDVTKLMRELGFHDRKSFFASYGYQYETRKGGRPSSTSATDIMSELESRYPSGSGFTSIKELSEANPDLAAKLKTLSNKSSELFGTTFQKYLIQKGILEPKLVPSELITELRIRYPHGTDFHTLKELVEANPDLASKLRLLRQRSQQLFGVPLSEYLLREGLLKEASLKQKNDEQAVQLDTLLQGISKYSKTEKLTLTQWPTATAALDFSLPFSRGPIKQLEVKFDGKSAGGDRFYQACTLKLPNEITQFPDFDRAFPLIRSFTVPPCVTAVPDNAFCGWAALENITFPDGIRSFGSYSFADCKSLQEIVLPDSARSVEQGAFEFCINLRSVHLPAALREIWDEAFSHCTMLQEISLPQDVEHIGEGAFGDCKRLQRATLPPKVQMIARSTFVNCAALTQIDISESVRTIGENAFSGCRSLECVTLPSKLTTIGDNAFKECTQLRQITFPAGLTTIGHAAFEGCVNLESVQLPTGTAFAADSFPANTKVLGGAAQAQVEEQIELKLDDAAPLAENTVANRKAATDGQAVEVHRIQYRFSTPLEVVTKDGHFIGFVASRAAKGRDEIKKMKVGQAFDATLKHGKTGELLVTCAEHPVIHDTAFHDRTEMFNWKRKNFNLRQCPVQQAVFSVETPAALYGLASGHDNALQYEEYKAAFSEELANRVYNHKAKPFYNKEGNSGDPNEFYHQEISLTMLEYLPLGTEFEVKIDTVDVPFLHSKTTEDGFVSHTRCAYPVPAFVLSYQGVRVANIPLTMHIQSGWPFWRRKMNYSAFLAFWKWSQSPTLTARAWLVNINKWDPDFHESEPSASFVIGFFPGDQIVDGSLALERAAQHNCDAGVSIKSVRQLMEQFADAQQINLSSLSLDSDGVLGLRYSDGTISRLPPGMFRMDLCKWPQNEFMSKRNQWISPDWLLQICREKKSENIEWPPQQEDYVLCDVDEYLHLATLEAPEDDSYLNIYRELKCEDEVLLELIRNEVSSSYSIAVRTMHGALCGLLDSRFAAWLSPLWDTGVVQVGRTTVADVSERTNDLAEPVLKVTVNITLQLDNDRYVVAEDHEQSLRRGEQNIPFALLEKDSLQTEGLNLARIYELFPQLYPEYILFYKRCREYLLKSIRSGHYFFMTHAPKLRLLMNTAGTSNQERRKLCQSMKSGDHVLLRREPKNPKNPNAIAVDTEHSEFVHYIPASAARWLSPFLDSGVFQLEDTKVDSVSKSATNPFIKLDLSFVIDEKRFTVLQQAYNHDVPFVLLEIDPQQPLGVRMSDIYRDTPLGEAYQAFCSEFFAQEKTADKKLL